MSDVVTHMLTEKEMHKSRVVTIILLSITDNQMEKRYLPQPNNWFSHTCLSEGRLSTLTLEGSTVTIAPFRGFTFSHISGPNYTNSRLSDMKVRPYTETNNSSTTFVYHGQRKIPIGVCIISLFSSVKYSCSHNFTHL